MSVPAIIQPGNTTQSLRTSGLKRAIGLMSGTSLDGIDVAIIGSDGEKAVQFGPAVTYPYDDEFRNLLKSVLGKQGQKDPKLNDIERELTSLHGRAVIDFMDRFDLGHGDVDVIGFHGHTVFHDPDNKITHQLGDGQMLADQVNIPVVGDFRLNDVSSGGQGAPLAPIYHQALVNGTPDLALPVCVLNLGGISNVTFIGKDHGIDDGANLLAFDTGPCNSLLDEWIFKKTGKSFDDGGKIAKSGKVDEGILKTMLASPYFSKPNPKSLDRLDFNIDAIKDLSTEDGAATLTRFIAGAVKTAQSSLPATPTCWVLTGGGAHNKTLLSELEAALLGKVICGDEIGWNSDGLEAQAFAYLALRSLAGLPITYPGTTGTPQRLSGGKCFKPVKK